MWEWFTTGVTGWTSWGYSQWSAIGGSRSGGW